MDFQTRKATLIGSSHQFFGMLIVPVLIPYLLLNGFSDQQIAFYWMIFPFIGIFASLGLGEVVKKVHVSWLMFFLLTLNAAAIPFYIIAQDWSVFIGRILDGISFTSITILTLTKLEAHVREKRGQATGSFLTIQQTAKYGSPIIGGFLGEVFLLLPMIISFVGLLTIAFFLKHPSIQRTKHVPISFGGDIKKYIGNRRMQLALVFGSIGNFLLVFRDIFIPLIIVSTFGLTAKSVGLATTFFGSGGLFHIFWGRVSDRLTPRRSMQMSIALIALGWVCISIFAHTYWIFLGFLILISCAQALWSVSTFTYIGCEPAKDIGTDISFYATFSKISVFIGTGLVAFLLSSYSYLSIIFYISCCALILTLLSSLIYFQDE